VNSGVIFVDPDVECVPVTMQYHFYPFTMDVYAFTVSVAVVAEATGVGIEALHVVGVE
jgi:hypothetical protein